MIILIEFLQDFLIIKVSNEELAAMLRGLGLQIDACQDLARQFADYRTAKIDNDLTVVNSANEIVPYAELAAKLPLLRENGIDIDRTRADKIILDDMTTVDVSLAAALNLHYPYFISADVWNIYQSYYDLCQDLATKYQLEFLDKQSFTLNSRAKISTKDLSILFSESACTKNKNCEDFASTNELNPNTTNNFKQILILKSKLTDFPEPKWLYMRLFLHNISADNFPAAIAAYVQIEYARDFTIRQREIVNANCRYNFYYLESTNADLLAKVSLRIEELWQQSLVCKTYVYEPD